MTTIPYLISKILPRATRDRMTPVWQTFNSYRALKAQGGKVFHDRELQTWVATKRLGNLAFDVPVRSRREFLRVVRFGQKDGDIAFDWLNAIDDCETLYDIGAANGHEGLFAAALHHCKVVFVEIFTPSIESILKGVILAQRRGAKAVDFEVVPAGADAVQRYSRVLMHEMPNAGNTMNTFGEPEAYARGGRAAEQIKVTQWLPSITIDSLHLEYGMPAPTHVIMDIDGFETKAIAGAKRTLAARQVRSWMIEISPPNFDAIGDTMTNAGYSEIARMEHYPGTNDCVDILYVRHGMEDSYRAKMAASKAQRIGAWA